MSSRIMALALGMIAKGNRGDVVTEACKKHGGFYLGTIGGVAAVLSEFYQASSA